MRYALCQAIRRVLIDELPAGTLSKRAVTQLGTVRCEYPWLEHRRTAVVRGPTGTAWWTFGGLCANAAIGAALQQQGIPVGRVDNFEIPVDAECKPSDLEAAVEAVRKADPSRMMSPVDDRAIDDLKFSVCLPRDLAVRELEVRLTDAPAIRAVLAEPVTFVTAGAG